MTKHYNEHVITSIKDWDERIHCEGQHNNQGENWGNHWGMNVGQLLRILATYQPMIPVVIRRDIGWEGMMNQDVEVKHILVKSPREDDYPQCREAIKENPDEAVEVLALTMSDYSTEDVFVNYEEGE